MSTDPANIHNAPPAASPLNPDLAGYPDVPSLVAGYRNSSDEGKRQRERADRLEAFATKLLTEGPGANRQDIPDRRGPSAMDRLSTFGVPTDALDEYVGGRIKEAVDAALRPLTRGVGARAQVVREHPDYVKFEADVSAFIEQDPLLSRAYPAMFEADPVGALEYAFLRFGESRRRAAGAGGGNGNGAGHERPGLADAAVPSSRSGDSRRAPDAQGDLQAAFERYQQTGSPRDAERYAKLRLRSVISDQFLNQ